MKGVRIFAIAGLCAVLGAALPFAASPAVGGFAEESPRVVYEKGDFDSFFEQDYDLLQRSYNTFTSLAGDPAIAPLDNHAIVSGDPLHADNRAVKLGFTEGQGTSGFNTFFTLFSRPLSNIAPKGGTFQISFDLYADGWDDSDVNALDKKIWFKLETQADIYFIAQDPSAVVETNVRAYESFPESDALDGYRHITYEIELSRSDVNTQSVTFWFYNAMGKTTAYLDNFEIKYEGRNVIEEGTFENFDLSVFACPDAADQRPLVNYGVSSRSALEEYSPAMLWNDNGNRVLRMKQGQSVVAGTRSGPLVDWTLGGGRLFEEEGTYVLSADVKLDYEEFGEQSLSLTASDFETTQEYYGTNLLGGGEVSYLQLADSAMLDGWKHIDYTFVVTEEDAIDWTCLTLLYNTSDGGTLYLDNLTITEAGSLIPVSRWQSSQTVDRSVSQGIAFITNLGDLPVTMSFSVNGTDIPVDKSYVLQQAGYFEVFGAFFDTVSHNGPGELTVASDYGTIVISFELTGESRAPTVDSATYDYGGAGDLSVEIDLKGYEIVSVTNDGIRLTSGEYAVYEEGGVTKLILRESYLKGLSGTENAFVVTTDGGRCTFNVSVVEGSPEGNNSALWWGLGSAGAAVVLAAGVTAFVLTKRKKGQKDDAHGSSDDAKN